MSVSLGWGLAGGVFSRAALSEVIIDGQSRLSASVLTAREYGCFAELMRDGGHCEEPCRGAAEGGHGGKWVSRHGPYGEGKPGAPGRMGCTVLENFILVWHGTPPGNYSYQGHPVRSVICVEVSVTSWLDGDTGLCSVLFHSAPGSQKMTVNG